MNNPPPVIDLTSSPRTHNDTNVVTPQTTYNSYSLTLNFWDNDETNAEDITGNILLPISSHTYYGPRRLRLVLIYLKSEQDKFRGISETRGVHWRNSWSTSVRTIVNYWHVYGEEPKWFGDTDYYLFGVGLAIRNGIRRFIEDNHLEGNDVVIGGHTCNVDLVEMLKAERHYHSARAIRQWSDDCGLLYRPSERKIFKSASRGVNLEILMNNFLPNVASA